ncbi:MAG: histidine phosphatase family protein [Pseudomonadota bacterium]
MELPLKYTRIFLWRHPEVQGAKDGRYFGHTDVPLTRQGKLQVRAVLKRMAHEKISAVYSSDLQRARLLADAIARGNNPRRKVEVLESLRELNLGQWEGMSFQEIARRYPQDLAARQADLASFRIPDGESLEDLAARLVPSFQQMVADNQGGIICVVAHAGVNRVILAKMLGAPLDRVFRLEQEYACLNMIDVYEDGIPVIKRVNEPPAIEEE